MFVEHLSQHYIIKSQPVVDNPLIWCYIESMCCHSLASTMLGGCNKNITISPFFLAYKNNPLDMGCYKKHQKNTKLDASIVGMVFHNLGLHALKSKKSMQNEPQKPSLLARIDPSKCEFTMWTRHPKV